MADNEDIKKEEKTASNITSQMLNGSIIDYIKEHYPDIYESMQEESYSLCSDECDFFNELVYDSEVVGFATYDHNYGSGDYMLKDIYIIPEYKSKHYLYDELYNVLSNGYTLSIYQPEHQLIDKLIEDDLAVVVDDNLILTAVGLDVSNNNILYKHRNVDLKEGNIYTSYIYNPEISALIIIPQNPKDKKIYYSEIVESDKNNYDVVNNRRRIKKKYFAKLKKQCNKKWDEYSEVVKQLHESLPQESYTPKDLSDTNTKVFKYLDELENNENFTKEKIEELKDKLIFEYDDKHVLSKDFYKRLRYLSTMNEEEIDGDNDENKCSYCNQYLNLSRSCPNCGYYNISKDEFEENINKIEEEEYKNFIADVSKEYFPKEEMINQNILELDYDNQVHEIVDWQSELDELNEVFVETLMLTLTQLTKPYSIKEAILKSCIFTNIDVNDLFRYIKDHNLASTRCSRNTWKLFAHELTNNQLKDILRQSDEKVSGIKNQLINRITENVDVSKINISKYYNVTPVEFGEVHILTEEGLELLRYYQEYQKSSNRHDNSDWLGKHNGCGMNYINRQKDENYDFIEYLKDNESYLYNNLIEENPGICLNDKYDYYKFYEIGGKNIGFSLFKKYESEYNEIDFTMEYNYIIEEYEDEIKFLDDILSGNMIEIAIHNPTRDDIEKMLKENLAEKINDRFVDTHTLLLFDATTRDDALNSVIEHGCNTPDNDNIIEYLIDCAVYDLELCTPASRFNFNRKDEDIAQISIAQKEDDDKYSCLEKRRNDSWIKEGSYHEKVNEVINIWTAITHTGNGYDYWIDDDEKEKTEEYYEKGKYKESIIYKEYF